MELYLLDDGTFVATNFMVGDELVIHLARDRFCFRRPKRILGLAGGLLGSTLYVRFRPTDTPRGRFTPLASGGGSFRRCLTGDEDIIQFIDESYPQLLGLTRNRWEEVMVNIRPLPGRLLYRLVTIRGETIAV